MDQDETWRGDRPQPWPHCVRWEPSSTPQKGAQPPQFLADVYCGQTAGWIKMPLFSPCLLWPNGRPSQLLLSTCKVVDLQIQVVLSMIAGTILVRCGILRLEWDMLVKVYYKLRKTGCPTRNGGKIGWSITGIWCCKVMKTSSFRSHLLNKYLQFAMVVQQVWCWTSGIELIFQSPAVLLSVPLFTEQHKLLPAKGGDVWSWKSNRRPGRN